MKELRTINKSVGPKANLRKILKREPELMDEEMQDAGGDEAFQDWAEDHSTTEDQLLVAIGNGAGDGNRQRPRFVPTPRARPYGQRPNGQQSARPPLTDEQRAERLKTTRCYNCDGIGHIGKDCPYPDKRLQQRPDRKPNGSARSLSPLDTEGFKTVGRSGRIRLCALTEVSRGNNFAALTTDDIDSESGDELSCRCAEGLACDSVNRSTAGGGAVDNEPFPNSIGAGPKS